MLLKKMALILVACVASVLLAGCAKAAAPEPTATLEPTATSTDTPEPTKTSTASATPTEEPTATTAATHTATPTLTATPTKTATPTPTDEEPTATTEGGPTATIPVSEAPDFVPGGDSVWQLDNEPSNEYSTEACGGHLEADFYGLVAVSKISVETITWRIPDGTTYTLQRTHSNSYWGIGASTMFQGYDLSIAVVFTGSESLGVTYSLLSKDVEGCYHVYQYGGKRAW